MWRILALTVGWQAFLLGLALLAIPAPPLHAGTRVGAEVPPNLTTGNVVRFLACLEQAESDGDPCKVGDGGLAVGSFQIHRIYVDDVCRILGRRAFTYADRKDPAKSREMARIYIGHYATAKRLGRTPTWEDAERIHNGGGNGWKNKAATQAAWERFCLVADREGLWE